MIGDILQEVYGDSQQIIKEQIQKWSVVSSCLFRSFDGFTQNIIFRIITNGGTINIKEIISQMDKTMYYRDGNKRLDDALMKLEKLKIITRSSIQNSQIVINAKFQSKLHEYIENPFKLNGELSPQSQQNNKEFFNLLGLLKCTNNILRQCKIGLDSPNGQLRLTKQNFDFIRLPLGYKISILIKGYLLYKKRSKQSKTLVDILCLSLINPNKKYKMSQKHENVLKQLQTIKLVKKLQNQNYFIINEYLHNFAFEQKANDIKLLDCSMIVETNFKIYIQLPQKSHQTKLIKQIMRLLLIIDNDDIRFEELIVGQITKDKMSQIFKCKISVLEYLSFFRNYMSGNLSIQKDLGKWNKIHYLGLQVPSQESLIPNNIKQELTLWEIMYNKQL